MVEAELKPMPKQVGEHYDDTVSIPTLSNGSLHPSKISKMQGSMALEDLISLYQDKCLKQAESLPIVTAESYDAADIQQLVNCTVLVFTENDQNGQNSSNESETESVDITDPHCAGDKFCIPCYTVRVAKVSSAIRSMWKLDQTESTKRLAKLLSASSALRNTYSGVAKQMQLKHPQPYSYFVCAYPNEEEQKPAFFLRNVLIPIRYIEDNQEYLAALSTTGIKSHPDRLVHHLWRNHILLREIPSCVTIVKPSGSVISQNPASVLYWGTRSCLNFVQSAHARAQVCTPPTPPPPGVCGDGPGPTNCGDGPGPTNCGDGCKPSFKYSPFGDGKGRGQHSPFEGGGVLDKYRMVKNCLSKTVKGTVAKGEEWRVESAVLSCLVGGRPNVQQGVKKNQVERCSMQYSLWNDLFAEQNEEKRAQTLENITKATASGGTWSKRMKMPPSPVQRALLADLSFGSTAVVRDHYHSVQITQLKDPVNSALVYVIIQTDVTETVQKEQKVKDMLYRERTILKDMLPPHVLDKLILSRQGLPDPHRPPPIKTFERSSSSNLSLGMVSDMDMEEMARYHEMVTVLQCDIKGFTALSQVVHPSEIMKLLNDLFSKFDDLIDEAGVQKIETIGDAYVVAGGLFTKCPHGWVIDPNNNNSSNNTHQSPNSNTHNNTKPTPPSGPDSSLSSPTHTHRDMPAMPHDPHHAQKVIAFARGVIHAAKSVTLPNGRPLELRVGVHSGPVMSGVVGSRMPRFCLFGQTMLTTGKVEAGGEVCQVHVSDVTKAELGGERWVEGGGVEVQGKTMKTWHLVM